MNNGHYDLAYRNAFNRTQTPMALVSKDGYFIVANEAYCKLLEYSELELQRRTFMSVTDPEDIDTNVDESLRVAEGKITSYEMNKSYITKSKRLIKVRLRVDGVYDEDDNFICFVSQCYPIRIDSIPAQPNIDVRTAKVVTWLHKNGKVILWIITGLIALAGYILKEANTP